MTQHCEYAYDYRTRRVQRSENGVSTDVVFSGGTSVQEYPSAGMAPTVEYVRGSDWGGGVGGLLYSLRNNAPSFAHYNSRGDVVAKTNASGTLTYQTSYETDGQHLPGNSFGTNLDRQQTNTKEEGPAGLVNDGERIRELETGVFLTRDPAGMVDGPNKYAYVQQNPWSKFDPEGLAGRNTTLTPIPDTLSPTGHIILGIYEAIIMPGIGLGLAVAMPVETGRTIKAQASADYDANGKVGVMNRFNPIAEIFGGAIGIDPIQGNPLTAEQRSQSIAGGVIGAAAITTGVVSAGNKLSNIFATRAADAPAVLMENDPFHNATRGIFNRLRSEIATRQGVSPRKIDWSQVQSGTAWRLAEEQLEAARVPADIRQEYFKQFNQYLNSIKNSDHGTQFNQRSSSVNSAPVDCGEVGHRRRF